MPPFAVGPAGQQWRSQLDKWGGGGYIHIFVFTDRKNNQFQNKLIMPPTYRAGYATAGQRPGYKMHSEICQTDHIIK